MKYASKENSTDNEVYIGNFFEEYHIKKYKRFKDIKIEQLELTMKTYFTLKRNNCFTVWDLLSLSKVEVTRMRYIEEKSVNEIVEMVVDISNTKYYFGKLNVNDGEVFKIKCIIVEELLNGNFLNHDQLSQIESQSKFYVIIANTIELLGKEFCSVAYYEPDKLVPIMQALNEFSKETDEI